MSDGAAALPPTIDEARHDKLKQKLKKKNINTFACIITTKRATVNTTSKVAVGKKVRESSWVKWWNVNQVSFA